MSDQTRMKVRERITLQKFDGEYAEGAEPVETIVLEVEDGKILSRTETRREP